jgi:hypothetical protein
VDITAGEALAVRMTSLLLRNVAEGAPLGRARDVADVVSWFGAMQAQDAASALWSLGARLPKLTSVDVHAALERREALRTWPMRGTVHLVPPRDARWMVELMGPRVIAGSTSRRIELGISDRIADRATELLAAALAGGGRLTRAECLAVLAVGGIAVDGQRGYHLLGYAGQRAVVCMPDVGNLQTFVLLEEWAPDPYLPERDEALATIAVRYFRSHGPTTRQDFAGWTGLTAADARRGIAVALAEDRLTVVRVDGQEMFADPVVLDSALPPGGRAGDVLALPGFDEYLLGYKDRTLMLDMEHKQAIIPGGNGVFQSTVVRDGRVIGTWRRSVARGRTAVAVHPLVQLSARDRGRVEQAMAPYGRFTGSPVDVSWV